MKKVWNVIKNLIVWLVVIATVTIMVFTIVSVNTFDQNHRSLFGYKAFIVRTDSMSASGINSGDIVLIKDGIDPSTLKEGDIISYISQSSANYGETVTHMIKSKTVDSMGNPGFITYGTTTGAEDDTVVTYSYVLGKHVATVPKLGLFFQFLKTTPGYIICILIPFMLLIGMQGIKVIGLFRRYKKEQLEELEAEKAAIDEERKRSAEMMEELKALREQLAQNAPAKPTAADGSKGDK